MINVRSLAQGVLFAFFSMALSGCSETETNTTSSGGNEGAPAIQISPLTDFDFGTVTEGNSTAPLEVSITNNGAVRLDISDISLSSSSNNFLLDEAAGAEPCTFSTALLKDESCSVKITFQPQQAATLTETFTATLDIVSNDPDRPNIQLGLEGTIEPVSPVMNVTINQIEVANCPEVTAYVSVTDHSNFPIVDLLAGDFTITEDAALVGNLTNASFVGEVIEPISLALVMDNSSSMQDIDIAEMEKEAIKIIEQLKLQDEAEIIKFDKVVYTEQAFTSDTALLIAAINTVRDGSGTALYDAIIKAVDDTAMQPSKRKAVIVITDGNDSNSSALLDDVIVDAEAKGVPVFVIALGLNVNKTALEQITLGSSGEFYEANIAQNLGTIFQQQLAEVLFSDQYILKYDSLSTGGSVVNLSIGASKSGGFSGVDSRQIMLCQ